MKKRHLVRTVEDCTPTLNLFNTKKEMKAFIKKFNKKFQNKEMNGYWIDIIVMGITDDITVDGEILK